MFDGGKDGGVKGLLEVLLGERGALDVVRRPDLLRHALGPGVEHGLDLGAVQVDEHVDVQEEVRLRAHQHDGRRGVVRPDLGHPLLGDVVEGGGVDHAEAEDEDVRVGVGQCSEAVEFLLKCHGSIDGLVFAPSVIGLCRVCARIAERIVHGII